MSTVIRLDANALSSLIEMLGDDFVLELKAAVLNESLGRHIKSVIPAEAMRVVDQAIKDEVQAQLGKTGYGKARITPALEKKVKHEVDICIRDLVHEKLSESEELIGEKLEEALTGLQYQFERRLQKRTNTMMDAVIQDAVESRVELALAANGVEQ